MDASPRSTRDIIIRTPDWQAACDFYKSIMGFSVTHESVNLVGLETGSIRLYVEKGSPHGPVFEFLVQDVQATKDRLLSAGCSIQEEDSSVPRCYIRDPHGLVFNLGRAPSATGAEDSPRGQ